MAMRSSVELKDFVLNAEIGTYAPGQVVPRYHTLDLTLWINPKLVFIPVDGLQHVFDYDPLMAEIQDLAADGHYYTQERLITRIVQACAVYPVIEAIDLSLRKFPVSADSGSLGVRLSISDAELRELRNRA